MPKSGQRWDPTCLARHRLLQPLTWVAPELATWAEWPALETFTDLAERRRRSVCPELSAVRFVTPEPKRKRAPRTEPIAIEKLYDGRIALRSEVPCLGACFHDLFNVLVWASFPRSKRALHGRQYRALREWLPAGASLLPGRRTREQDALTVFDEGGSVVLLSQTAAAAWRHALAQGSSGVPLPDASCLLFGHALMEHVLHGLPTVRSSALVLVSDEPRTGLALLDWVDAQVTERLRDPARFVLPGADAVVTLTPDGGITLGAPAD